MMKIFEDETYIVYSYSHDSDTLCGIIKVEKAVGRSRENRHKPMENFAEITPSATDTNNFFAMRALAFIVKICCSDTLEFPERKQFAWG